MRINDHLHVNVGSTNWMLMPILQEPHAAETALMCTSPCTKLATSWLIRLLDSS